MKKVCMCGLNLHWWIPLMPYMGGIEHPHSMYMVQVPWAFFVQPLFHENCAPLFDVSVYFFSFLGKKNRFHGVIYSLC